MIKKINGPTIAVIACMAVLFVSCKKLDSAPPADNTAAKTKLLTAGKWKTTSFELLKTDGTWEINTPTVEYTLTFHEDKTVNGTIGSTAFVQSWSVNDDFTEIRIFGTKGTGNPITIEALSATSLKFFAPSTTAGYVSQRQIFTH